MVAYTLWIVAVLHALDVWRTLRRGREVTLAVVLALAVTLQATIGIATLLSQVAIDLALKYRPRYVLVEDATEAPSKKWSALKYVFWHQGGPICRGRSTSLKRLSRS